MREHKTAQDYIQATGDMFSSLITKKTRYFNCHIRDLLGKKSSILETIDNMPEFDNFCFKKFILLCYRFRLNIRSTFPAHPMDYLPDSQRWTSYLMAKDSSGEMFYYEYADNSCEFKWLPYEDKKVRRVEFQAQAG